MTIEKQKRINELAKLKKERGLTAEEAAEQKVLYQEYLTEWRNGMTQSLNARIDEMAGGKK
ncbi:MAG: DUF896 domain-containing protein [Clostridia bacterium]|nr:DUF896 domain-containing protein [Clostridia bacterium]